MLGNCQFENKKYDIISTEKRAIFLSLNSSSLIVI